MATARLATNGQNYDVRKYKNKYENIVNITMSNSYTTNGEALAPAECGVTTISDVVLNPSDGYIFEYYPATGKIKAFRQTAATGALVEVPNTTDLSAVTDITGIVYGD